MKRSDVIRELVRSDLLKFTTYLFRNINKRDYIVGEHHRIICRALNEVIDGSCRRLIINIAPRYGKTELAVKNFIAFGLAVNPASKFIHLSYSDDLALANSESVRDIVKSDAYQALFPEVMVKDGSDSKKKWATTAGGDVYATSTGGQVTGFGAGDVDSPGEDGIFSGAIVIDDPIKPEDAFSDSKREKINQRFETTIRNRVNSRKTPIIIIMQRLHENDLCGYLTKAEPGKWTVISLPCVKEDGSPLWPFKHTLKELQDIRRVNPYVYETQYMQNPTPMEGLMYGKFKTYREIPYTNRAIRKNYTDTADTGEDYLCSIDYIDTEAGNYVLDVLYTQLSMEATEPMVTRMLKKDDITVANIESNNGGRGFARNVEMQSRILGNDRTEIRWFHQSGNKESRIFTRSAEVMNLTYFPEGWETRWPEFYSAISGHRKTGTNAHDDAADCLTGTVEMRGEWSYEGYDHDVTGDILIEIHPLLNGKFVYCKAIVSDDVVYIDDAHIGQPIPFPDLLKNVSGAEVQMEASKEMVHYANDYRREVGEVWARRERPSKQGFIESYKEMTKSFKYRTDGRMSAFMRNLSDYDGKDVIEAMYVLCCIACRIKKK